MTRSLANCSWEGGTMDNPFGGLFFEVDGVFMAAPKGLSEVLLPSGSVGLAVFCSRDSMMCLCWSRTDMLLCSCCCMVGS